MEHRSLTDPTEYFVPQMGWSLSQSLALQSNPMVFSLSVAVPVAALLVLKAPRCVHVFVWAVKSTSECSLGCYSVCTIFGFVHHCFYIVQS